MMRPPESLFEYLPPLAKERIIIAPGAYIFRNCIDEVQAYTIIEMVRSMIQFAPLRFMRTKRGGKLSVSMSNCGDYGWISDGAGYCYSALDPKSLAPWPKMPHAWKHLAQKLAAMAGFKDFNPQVCLINRYGPRAKMGLHQDKDEQDLTQPIVSLSFGLSARFQFGGCHRADPVQVVVLHHGDAVIWGGPARLYYHGILPLQAGYHPYLGQNRINLTFRQVYTL